MNLIDRTVNRALLDAQAASAVSAAQDEFEQRCGIVTAIDGDDLPRGARAIVATIVQIAGQPRVSDETRGREVARLYAELKGLFDAER